MNMKFITFEGGEGSGKTTIIKMLTDELTKNGVDFIVSREPGGSKISEEIRNVILNVDNKEIVELCKKTSVNPKKDSKGQIYFSVDEVRRLKNAKSSIVSEMNEKKSALSLVSKPNSQMVVNNLLETLNKMENNITTSMTKLIDEKLEGMDDVVLELVRCKTENENLKNKVNELNKENFKLKNILNSFNANSWFITKFHNSAFTKIFFYFINSHF